MSPRVIASFHRAVPIPRMKRLLITVLSSAAVALSACGGGGDAGPTPTVVDNTPATVALSPSGSVTLVSGATTTLSASVLNKSGTALSSAGVTWSSADATIASVSGGVVTALKAGTTTVSATAGSATAGVSVTVTPGAATTLALRTQPAGAQSGSVLASQPVVEIRDAAGNLVTTATNAVTVSIGSGGGTLGGSTTVSAVGGVATFSGLTITGTAGDRTLVFTATGLAAATSNAVTITVPAAPLIAVDNASLTLSASRGASPAAGKVNVTNGGGGTISALSVDAPTYDAGQTTGWLVPSLSGATAPATLTLAVNSAALIEGTYHAVVHVSAAGISNSPVTISVTLVITATYTVTYGTSANRVSVVDVNGTVAPPTSVSNNGVAVPGITVTYASRSPSVATVGSDGRITALAPGDAWIVATAPQSSDSVFVIVPQNATGPVLRSTLTNYQYKIGDTALVTFVLDARSAVVGAATIAIDESVTGTATALVPTGPPVPAVTLTQSGVFQISVAAAAGMTGTTTLVTLRIISTRAVSGWIRIYGLDLSGTDGSSQTSITSSTRVPLVFK